jgi:hypothetical protein
MGAAKITAAAKIKTLPVIHLISYLLALASHVKRTMTGIRYGAKSDKIDVSFAAFST